MSWHCLQGGAEAFSLPGYLDSIRSARSRLSQARERCCLPDRGMECCRGSRFGTMCRASMDGHGEDLSMSYPAAFRAKTFPAREKEQESREPEAGSGERCSESFARFDRDTRSWRIHPCLFPEDSPLFLGTWPKSGIMRHGVCWELPTLEHPTSATEFGFLRRIPDGETFFHTPTCGGLDGGSNSRKALRKRLESRHLIPTPTACNAPNSGANTKGPKSLLEVARTGWNPGETWPTPTAHDAHKPHPSDLTARQGGRSLAASVMLPTPTCQDASNNGGPSQMNRNTPPLNAVAGGALNPVWVEWLMGWPIGWTDCERLAMDRFRWWLRSHLRFLRDV